MLYNIDIYPEFNYNISKIFVRLKDGSELIRINAAEGFNYLLEHDFEEETIEGKEKELVDQFFSLLFKFKFVY